MNYVELHLGDWAQAVAHLSLVEEAVYLRLLRWVYGNEKPLPADLAACQRLAGARSQEEREAVAAVLAEFFTLTDEGHRNKRADEEIEKVRGKQAKAAASAKARWNANAQPEACERNANASKTDANAMRTQCERNALQSPDTNHQKEQDQKPSAGKPPRKSKRDLAAEFPLPEWVDRALWVKWIAVRNRPEAGLPENLAKLTGWRQQGIDPARVLLEAIAGGWQGLYLPKDIAHENRTSTGGKLSAVESVQAAIARRAANTAVDFIDADFTRNDRTAMASHG